MTSTIDQSSNRRVAAALRLAARAALLVSLASAAGLGCGDDDDDDHDDGDDHGKEDAATKPPPKKDSGTEHDSGVKPEPDAGTGGGTKEQAETWPMMGYDTRNNYWNPADDTISVKSAGSLEVRWQFTVAGFPPGTPVIAEGKVFVLATGGLYAIDLETGFEAWSNLEIKGTSSAAYDDGFIYVHAAPDGDLYKIKASNGDVLWGPVRTYDEVAGTDGTSSPIVADGMVFAGHSTSNEVFPADPSDQTNARGGVFAADIATGDEAWHYFTVELPENGAMVWSTVSVDLEAGVLYACTGNNYTVAGAHSDAIHAIELKTGDSLWSKQVREGDAWTLSTGGSDDTDFGANPILADVGGKKLVAAGDKASAFWALDRTTGKILWSREDLSPSHMPANGGVLNNGAFDGKYFYVASNDPAGGGSMLHALDPAKDGEDAWMVPFDKITWGAPTGANGVLYVPMDTLLYVLDAKTGEQLKMFETGGSIAAGGAAIAAGRVVVASGLQYPLSATVNNDQIICYGLPD